MKAKKQYVHILTKPKYNKIKKWLQQGMPSQEEDTADLEAAYFAMVLLIPEEPLQMLINFLGGMEIVKEDANRKQTLARVFNVEEWLIEARIKDIDKEPIQLQKVKQK